MLHFLGIGAQKSGTTWLYHNLKKHPAVFLTEEKELHFWNSHKDRGLDWYRAQFAPAPAGAVAGEITPAYGILPSETVAEIKREFPELRLIYLIRNPIERAWSGALMAIPRAEMTVEEASDTWFIDHFNSQGSASRGDYETCLRVWRSHFPAARIHVDTFDEIVSNPRGVLQRCSTHLGIDPTGFDSVPDDSLMTPLNVGLRRPMRPTLHHYLDRLYRPKIESLGRYLGRDLSHWLAGPARPLTPLQRLRLSWSARAHHWR
ncbi:sulfotransferase [Azospirillum sp. A1-3]|uniref:sulfotransferase family protein n=1 Tax=Azospirillum sp. A1-3 TaxID=185874 RepID=UPI002076D753|nr:sulfotransferase [Azospirillum sp. A1-3]MCM8738700.1 sulfotransferase [Azospirillum sp. A1-3]